MGDGDDRTTRRDDRCLECGRKILSGYLCTGCDDVTFMAEPADGD